MEESKSQHNNKAHDPLKPLKYKGYCRSMTPPGENMTLDDLTTFAKFFLCKHAAKLWKDPIWEDYTDEEILVEYFSHLFVNNSDAKSQFEAQINAGTELYGEDIYDWLDRMVEQNQKEMKEQLESLPDKVSFTPGMSENVEA